jgi:hypothetical protein
MADPQRPADPQGQAARPDRVRLRLPAGRDHREHPPRRPRPDHARPHQSRLTQRARVARRQRQRELRRAGLHPRDVAVDGGFAHGPSSSSCPTRPTCSSPGAKAPGSKHTERRLARYRVGAEGRISVTSNGLRTTPPPPTRLDGARTTVGARPGAQPCMRTSSRNVRRMPSSRAFWPVDSLRACTRAK